MAFLKRVNQRAKTSSNTGFGDNASNNGGRFVNKNGKANIRKTGIGLLERYSWFHTMLEMPGWKFFLIILCYYVIINFIFAFVYYLLGMEHLVGTIAQNEADKFWEAFFFSSQTFTTVGYGRISPVGFVTSGIAAFQALIGLLTLAVATGLLYARFSKPTAYLKFSGNAVIAPYKEIKALMIRLAPFKNTTLTDAEARLTLGLIVDDNGRKLNRFFPLELELEKINALPLSWTLVHPITEDSPLYGFTAEDYKNTPGEILVFIKAFDDKFSNTVVTRTSYTFNEVIYEALFNPMFHRDEENNTTVLDLSRLNDFKRLQQE